MRISISPAPDDTGKYRLRNADTGAYLTSATGKPLGYATFGKACVGARNYRPVGKPSASPAR